MGSPSGSAAAREMRSLVRAVSRRAARLRRLGRGGGAAGAGVGALLILAVLDALTPMQGAWRAGVSLMAYAIVVWVMWSAGRRGETPDPASDLARAVKRAGADRDRVLCAADLALASEVVDPIGRALTERAIARGLTETRSIDARRAVDARPALRGVLLLIVVVAITALVEIAAPGFVAAQSRRLFALFGDAPPYSRVHLRLAVDTVDLRIGDDAEVRVWLERGDVSGVALRVRDAAGVERAAAMTPGAGVFHATLRDMRRPVRVRAEVGRARTRWRMITPERRPRVRRAALTIIPPAYTGLSERTAEIVDAGAIERAAMLGSVVRLTAWVSMDARADAAGSDQTGDGAGAVWAEWTIRAPGARTYQLDAVAPGGFGLDRPITAVVRGAEDEPPALRITRPASHRALVEVNRHARIEAIVTDDVAPAALSAETRVAGAWRSIGSTAGGQGGALRVGAFENKRWSAAVALDPAALGAKVGDSGLVRLRARDARPAELGGPGESVSEVVEFVVVAPGSGGGVPGDGSRPITGGGAGERTSAEPGDGDAAERGDSGGGTTGGEPGTADGSDHSNERSPSAGDAASGDSRGAKSGKGGGASRDAGSTGSAGADDPAGGPGKPPQGVGGASPLGFGESGVGPAALDPGLLRLLPSRDRAIVVRYFLVMSRAGPTRSPRDGERTP